MCSVHSIKCFRQLLVVIFLLRGVQKDISIAKVFFYNSLNMYSKYVNAGVYVVEFLKLKNRLVNVIIITKIKFPIIIKSAFS